MPLHERDIHYFIDVTLVHLNKLTGNEIVLRDPTIEFQSLVFSAYTGLVHLKGTAEGFFYVTASQAMLQLIQHARGRGNRTADENCRDLMSDVMSAIANTLRKRFEPALQISDPRIFSTVPDDPIEMPPAVFVQPLSWRKDQAYVVLGLTPSEP